jgi:hypothetical protein
MVIGRFPIPTPSRHEYARIFGVRPEDVELQYSENDSEEDDGQPPRMMAIFELLDYIVNKVKEGLNNTNFVFRIHHFFHIKSSRTVLLNLLTGV